MILSVWKLQWQLLSKNPVLRQLSHMWSKGKHALFSLGNLRPKLVGSGIFENIGPRTGKKGVLSAKCPNFEVSFFLQRTTKNFKIDTKKRSRTSLYIFVNICLFHNINICIFNFINMTGEYLLTSVRIQNLKEEPTIYLWTKT